MAPKKQPSNNNVSLGNLTYEEALLAIKKAKGSQSIVGSKEIEELCSVGRVPTGIPTVDFLGGGGITEGRITIFAGNPSACKSTLSQQIVGAFQRKWAAEGVMKFVLWFDAEGAIDVDYCKSLGIDIRYLIVKRTKVIEDAFAEADQLISMGIIGLVVFDSLDAMIAKKVDDNAYGNTMGSQSGALAAHLPMLYNKILEHNVTTFIIKQARVKMDAMGAKGEIITFNGGKALRHFSDSIYIVKRMSNRDLNYTPIQIKAEKTRSSRMGLTLTLPLGECGIDPLRDLVAIAIEHGIVTGSTWLYYGDYKEQGKERFTAMVRSNKEVEDKLYKEVYESIINKASVLGKSSDECDEIVTDFDEETEG